MRLSAYRIGTVILLFWARMRLFKERMSIFGQHRVGRSSSAYHQMPEPPSAHACSRMNARS